MGDVLALMKAPTLSGGPLGHGIAGSVYLTRREVRSVCDLLVNLKCHLRL